MRFAEEINAAQERGEVATRGQRANARSSGISDYGALGLDRRRVAEWRGMADAGASPSPPGRVRTLM
jgi:hypothetical protein